jgi:hypothetical protein
MSAPTLRELLAAATPGKWDSPQSKPLIFINEEGQNFSGGDWIIYPPLGELGPVAIAGNKNNAQLIARLDPATMGAVLEALERARDRLTPTRDGFTIAQINAALALLNGTTEAK